MKRKSLHSIVTNKIYKQISSVHGSSVLTVRAAFFEKLRFRGGLVWTVGLTVKTSAAFLSFCGVVRKGRLTLSCSVFIIS